MSLFELPQFQANTALDPSNLVAANKGNTFAALAQNPLVQTMLLNFAQALDPNGFGGRLAQPIRQAIQAGEVAEGNAAATGTGATNAQAPKPAVVAPAGNPGTPTNASMDLGKSYTAAGKLLSDAQKLDPSIVNSTLTNGLLRSLNANPNGEAFVNPTQAVGSPAAGQLPVALNPSPVQPFALNKASAMSMTPEQLNSIYANRISNLSAIDAARRTGLMEASLPSEIAARNATVDKQIYDMSELAHKRQMEENSAAVLAQLDVYKGKRAFDIKGAADFIAKNPKLAATTIPELGVTYSSLIQLGAANPDLGQQISSIVNTDLDYRAALANASSAVRVAELKAKDESDKYKIDGFGKLKDLLANYEKYASAVDPEVWDAMNILDKQAAIQAGMFPRTPEIDKAQKTNWNSIQQIIKDYDLGGQSIELDNLLRAKELRELTLHDIEAKIAELRNRMNDIDNPISADPELIKKAAETVRSRGVGRGYLQSAFNPDRVEVGGLK